MSSNNKKFTYYPPIKIQVLSNKPSVFSPSWGKYFTTITNLIKELNFRVEALETQVQDHENRITALETP
jgi:hypothetical protein